VVEEIPLVDFAFVVVVFESAVEKAFVAVVAGLEDVALEQAFEDPFHHQLKEEHSAYRLWEGDDYFALDSVGARYSVWERGYS
jgi:hypothetical protein